MKKILNLLVASVATLMFGASCASAGILHSSVFMQKHPECKGIGDIPANYVKPEQVDCFFGYFASVMEDSAPSDIDQLTRLTKVETDTKTKTITFIHDIHDVPDTIPVDKTLKVLSILLKNDACKTNQNINAIINLGISIEKTYYIDGKKVLDSLLNTKTCEEFNTNYQKYMEEYKKLTQ